MTVISVEDVREKIGITNPTIPEHLYPDQSYDKWGNPVLPNGNRLKGELFSDESVQKVLKQGGVLDLFVEYVKYPRTHHVPWSPGIHDDDRVLKTMDHFHGKRVIVTEKMDGENTTMYRDYIHARSIDGRSHPSRDWVKQFWNERIRFQLDEGWRVCAENLFAQHSIVYDDLASYVYGFSIWNELNVCLDWDSTVEYFQILGITTVPVLYDGVYDEAAIRDLCDVKEMQWGTREGFVLRVAESFSYGNFRRSVAKYVRKGHVQTTKHWMHGQPVKKNGLKA